MEDPQPLLLGLDTVIHIRNLQPLSGVVQQPAHGPVGTEKQIRAR